MERLPRIYGGQIDAVYTEFEKAFDKVQHRRLISKLYSYGINEIVINWIRDFLTAIGSSGLKLI